MRMNVEPCGLTPSSRLTRRHPTVAGDLVQSLPRKQSKLPRGPIQTATGPFNNSNCHGVLVQTATGPFNNPNCHGVLSFPKLPRGPFVQHNCICFRALLKLNPFQCLLLLRRIGTLIPCISLLQLTSSVFCSNIDCRRCLNRAAYCDSRPPGKRRRKCGGKVYWKKQIERSPSSLSSRDVVGLRGRAVQQYVARLTE